MRCDLIIGSARGYNTSANKALSLTIDLRSVITLLIRKHTLSLQPTAHDIEYKEQERELAIYIYV